MDTSVYPLKFMAELAVLVLYNPIAVYVKIMGADINARGCRDNGNKKVLDTGTVKGKARCHQKNARIKQNAGFVFTKQAYNCHQKLNGAKNQCEDPQKSLQLSRAYDYTIRRRQEEDNDIQEFQGFGRPLKEGDKGQHQDQKKPGQLQVH